MTKKLTTEEYREIRDWMLENHPATFGTLHAPRPLGRGMGRVIPSHISRNKTRMFLARWTKRFEYRCALAAGGPRYDLDGAECGLVEDFERSYAAKEIQDQIRLLKKKGMQVLADKLSADPRFAPYANVEHIGR